MKYKAQNTTAISMPQRALENRPGHIFTVSHSQNIALQLAVTSDSGA